ncbi:hypothetical protein [Candidatus Phytoplasma sp. AldY-WA1]|uniref:hypothetical protein n=1 Tax=Candidatus Phytoplasma sp. AldY-WA1 TaxID=2852100 RepID=UPI002550D8A7|nr:hypothetical protein [Candidatus Phytoplasma sp. AldY-WA1]
MTNHFNNNFSYTFDEKYFVIHSQYSIDKIKSLKEFLFFLHKSLFMEECLTVNKLRIKNKLFRKSFEKYTQTQLNILKNDPAKKTILKACGDNKIYQIPLDPTSRLIGFFIKSCFHIVAYDPDHGLFPSKK